MITSAVFSNVRFWPVSDRSVLDADQPDYSLDLGLLCDLKRVVHLDTEVAHGAF